MEFALGAVFLIVLVFIGVRAARSHSRREEQALNVLSGMVGQRKADRNDEELHVP